MIGGAVAVSPEVAAFHRETLVVDLHNDALTKLSHWRWGGGYDFARRHRSAAFWNPARLDLDLPRLRDGGVDALGCLMFGGFRVGRARRFWRQLDTARTLQARHADALALVSTAQGVRDARAGGRVALLLGVEGAYPIEDDPEAGVARLAGAGVRFLGPLWDRSNRSGASCRARGPDTGLTDLGRRVVAACNAHGLLVDVSHASRKTFWDLHRASGTPVFASHAGAAAVFPHARNLDDDQIRAVATRGGVVGVIFVSFYLGSTFCDLERLADHVEHVASVGGDDAVALGSDFDGFCILPRGLRDVADLPRLTEVLWRRGWRPERLAKLLGGNALRYFTENGG